MQSRDGGWGAFDADNTHYYLNHIPFADHGALLDPPTADVTARCISMLAQLGYDAEHPALARALACLRREQEQDGSWFGRWGTNYVYGTWSVLWRSMRSARTGRVPMYAGGRLADRAPARGRRLGRGAAPATGRSARPSRSRARPPRPPGRCWA